MDAIIYTTNTGSAGRYAKLLADETGLPVYSFAEAKKEIAADTERDNYMSAREALSYGLIDKIIDKR